MADVLDGLTAALSDRYRLDLTPDGAPRCIGQGGMANVYLAHDLKHQRKVAVKVLRSELAAVVGAERFVQEIRVTASLQHPHILSLIDSGVIDNGQDPPIPYYVMPFVEGESLRAKLRRETQLSIEDAFEITKAVASALDYAHRHGVVHRDVKPENILLHEGQALVADFGIALALTTAGGSRLTETGLALGTPYYMSPEQGLAEREIGPRSDGYSLGCVVYEMLAGEPPFTGPTAQAIFAKAARDIPRSLTIARPSVSPEADEAVQRALAKLPADRFASGAEFVRALGLPTVSGPRTARVAGQTLSRRLNYLLAMAAVVATLVAGWGWLRQPRQVRGATRRFEITLPADVPGRDRWGTRIALAPDGSSFVYIALVDGVARLFVRRLDQTLAQVIPGTDGASVPFYSPDGKWVGFAAAGQLKKVALAGGDPITIATILSAVDDAAWGPQGQIVFTSFSLQRLSRVDAGGGAPEVLAAVDSAAGESAFAAPHFLADGRIIAIGIRDHGGRYNVDTLEIRPGAKGRRGRFLGGKVAALFGGPGWMIVDGHGLEAVRIDPSGAVAGQPRPLNFHVGSGLGSPQIAVSHEGTLIYLPDPGIAKTSLVLVDRTGKARPISERLEVYYMPRFAPDGRRVAVTVLADDGLGGDIWIHNLSGLDPRRLTFERGAMAGVFSPDGARVAYTVDDSVSWISTDGGGLSHRAGMQAPGVPSGWTRDGRSVVVDRNATVGDPWLVPLDSAVKAKRLFRSPFLEFAAVVSPDGRWLAYQSDESGQWEVYVQSFPELSGRTQVSLRGGSMPTWDRKGGLYYRSANRIYSATLGPGPGFSIAKREMLFESPNLRSADLERDYDVSPDGQHFVMLRRDDPLEKLMVVLNWSAELETIQSKGPPQ